MFHRTLHDSLLRKRRAFRWSGAHDAALAELATEPWNPEGADMMPLAEGAGFIRRLGRARPEDSGSIGIELAERCGVPQDEMRNLDGSALADFVRSRTDRNMRDGTDVGDGIVKALDFDLAARDVYFDLYGPGRRSSVYKGGRLGYPPDIPFSSKMLYINEKLYSGGYDDLLDNWRGRKYLPHLARDSVDYILMQAGRRIDLFGYGYRAIDALAMKDEPAYVRAVGHALLRDALETGQWQELPEQLQPAYLDLAGRVKSREEQPYFPLKKYLLDLSYRKALEREAWLKANRLTRPESGSRPS